MKRAAPQKNCQETFLAEFFPPFHKNTNAKHVLLEIGVICLLMLPPAHPLPTKGLLPWLKPRSMIYCRMALLA